MPKYVPFTHTFSDPWSDNEDKTLTFHFAKPDTTQIKRLQNTASKDGGQASRNLLLSIISEDDKEAFKQAAEEYPGLITTFAAAIVKGIGMSAELGN